MPVVKGKALFAFVQRPNQGNERIKPYWGIDVVVDEKTAKTLEKEGLNVGKKKNTGERFLRCKRDVYRKKDQSKNTAPLVVDAKKNTITDDIGNGSVVKVQYKTWDWTFAGKKGRSADLIAVQVLEYMPPPNQAGAEFEEEDGFEGDVSDPTPGSEFTDDIPY